MANEADNKFTWLIKNFSSSDADHIYSSQFVIGDCKWRLLAYPKGDKKDRACLALYLVVADSKTLPLGWRRHTKFSITLVNQTSENLSLLKKAQHWFDEKSHALGYSAMLPLAKLHDKDGGFVVNGQVKIVAEIDVLEVIGKPVESEDSNQQQPVKKVKREDDTDLLNMTPPTVTESIDVNGFQVFPSQVELVSRVFRKYPEIATDLRAKNEPLRTACMYVLLSLIEILCKSMEEFSEDNMVEAEDALTYLKHSGIKVDRLEQKLDEVKAKKKGEIDSEIRIQELEEELEVFKQKCSDIEAQMEIEKSKVLANRAPALTLDEAA
ncbi:unnamed protein product [Microthlaspi erraticum]|uniref:MATH domain-containing protein n=1 Tax=Microthlaspi erraticum TaxID=1685480 RepID=A0A6D2LHK7_9BRAS|nr:unnamed protein product [Microthlaspi erraticum]